MQTIQLRERQASRVSIRLSDSHLEALNKAGVEARPVNANGLEWELSPSSTIGMVGCDGVNFLIRPKIPIDHVMFLIGYAASPGEWRPLPGGLSADDDLLGAVVPAFVLRAQEAIRRGLLQGYRTAEESLNTVRGRIRLNEQINTRFGQALPVEVVYDDYTEDIEENRLLKAAIQTLWRMPILEPEVRRELGALRPAFTSVAQKTYRRDAVPTVHYDRLNSRYRPAVELARLIVGDTILELFQGEPTGASFLVDMNCVFEEFLRSSLREALRLSEYEWPPGVPGGRDLRLDDQGSIRLQPNMSWWQGRRCVFVADAKYSSDGKLHSDVYQLLAYCTAANLPSGMLIYPSEESETEIHRIANTDTCIEVCSLDINGTPHAIMDKVARIAERARHHRMSALNAGA